MSTGNMAANWRQANDVIAPGWGGSRRNIATPFGMEKLEWCGYTTVKNFEDMFIRFDMIHEHDRRTDRRTDTA